MKKWLSLLLVAATCVCVQAQVLRQLKVSTFAGQVPKTTEYKLLLAEIPQANEFVWYRFIAGKKTNEWVLIPQQNTGLSKAPVNGYYANIWFTYSKTNRGKIQFVVAKASPDTRGSLDVVKNVQPSQDVRPGDSVILADVTFSTTGEVQVANSGLLVRVNDSSLVESVQLSLNGNLVGVPTAFTAGQAWVGTPFTVSSVENLRARLVTTMKSGLEAGKQVQLSLTAVKTLNKTDIVGLPLSGAVATVTLVTNWSTDVVAPVEVSPFDPSYLINNDNPFIGVRAGDTYQLMAIRIFGTNLFVWDIMGEDAGPMDEGHLENATVSIIDSSGGSVTFPATPSDVVNFTAHCGGILIDGYVDVVFKGKFPSNTMLGRYSLLGIREEINIVVKNADGFRVHLAPKVFAEQDPETSEFCPNANPWWFSGIASHVILP